MMPQIRAQQTTDSQGKPQVDRAVTGLPTGRLIEYVLERLFGLCPEIDAGIAATHEGLLLGAKAREQGEAEDVAAVSSRILEESGRILQEMDHGNVTQLLIFGTEGYTLLKNIADVVFLAVSSKGNGIQRETYHAFLKAAKAVEVLEEWFS
jgi:predicted regulator of Ras-like GTPase activity (Roadblock/LC7/MglB family)